MHARVCLVRGVSIFLGLKMEKTLGSLEIRVQDNFKLSEFLEFPQNIKNGTAVRPSNPTSENIS